MIGGIISGGAGLLGGLFGGISAAKNRRKAENAIGEESRFNDNLFNQDYYSDPMQRSDNAALLRNLRTGLQQRTKQSAATAAVMGATPEAMMAEKEAANAVIGDTMSNIGAMNQQYKDNVMSRYLNQRQNTFNQQQSLYNNAAQQGANMMSNGLNAMVAGGTSIGEHFMNKKKPSATNTNTGGGIWT